MPRIRIVNDVVSSPLVSLAVAALILLSGISGALLSPAAAHAANVSVQIQGFAFGPDTLTVAVGDTVTWTNSDSAPHTATAESGAFDSGNLDSGQSFSYTFTTPGTYVYRCDYHSEMQGTSWSRLPQHRRTRRRRHRMRRGHLPARPCRPPRAKLKAAGSRTRHCRRTAAVPRSSASC